MREQKVNIIRNRLLLASVALIAFATAGWAQKAPTNDIAIRTPHGDFRAFVSIPDGQSYSFLKIAAESNGKSRVVASYRTSDTIVYMCPTYSSLDRLVTVWEGGSHVRTVIFKLATERNRQENVVFDRVAEFGPELLHAGPTSDLLLFSSGKHFHTKGGYSPETTEVYSWNGYAYKLLTTVPWRERLTVVSAMR